MTRISIRFAPLENSTQKCAAKTPLTRRESFIDRRRRSPSASPPPPPSPSPSTSNVFSFFPPPIHTYASYPSPSCSRGTILDLIESFSSTAFDHYHRIQIRGSLAWIFVSRGGREGGGRGRNESFLLEILGDSWRSTRSTKF